MGGTLAIRERRKLQFRYYAHIPFGWGIWSSSHALKIDASTSLLARVNLVKGWGNWLIIRAIQRLKGI